MNKIKDDSLFIMLSGFAKECVKSGIDTNSEFGKMASTVNQFFKTSRHDNFNNSQKAQIGKRISTVIEAELIKLGENSPQILLILAMDTLLNELRHTRSRVYFGHFNTSKMIDDIFKIKKYQKYIKSHSDFIQRIK